MNGIPYSLANNWNDFPELEKSINWGKAQDNNMDIIFTATINGDEWNIRINDFPDEPLYTLIINSEEIIHFDDLPDKWICPK